MIQDKRLRFIFSQRKKKGGMKEGNRGHARGCVHVQIQHRIRRIRLRTSFCMRGERRSLNQNCTDEGSQETSRTEVHGVTESSAAAATSGRSAGGRGEGGGGGGRAHWDRGDTASRNQRERGTRGEADRARRVQASGC